MTEPKNHIERTVALIGIVLTLTGAVVAIMQQQVESLDEKIVVQVSALQLEIERTRNWVDKVSSREARHFGQVNANAKDMAKLRSHVDRLAYIVDDLRRAKQSP